MNESNSLFSQAKKLCVRAWFVGARIDARELERGETLSVSPLTIRAGERGYAFLFRFGVAVFVELNVVEEANFVKQLEPFIQGKMTDPETEETDIKIAPELSERVDMEGTLILHQATLERLQVVANVLAKSVVLAHYENRVAGVFDRIERFAEHLRSNSSPARPNDLLREIGDVLLIQARTVGRVEVTEKPEITWDEPELDRLYERLAVEYELRERDLALSRKLELISTTAETYLELLQNRQSIRVEWYIVSLIVIEIVLILYELFVQ
ncbi:conserved hypothetical protein [Chloroherpeton thalassium ATCC 35110]|uniref:DUF155 domain-containing protein n=1 Tax=Chloroherpeton thalassium (strain ATCC 35110 / GB-78) TaxID=517418 RepID=B3QSQ3_CHLT3|nr:RMD1 family protein [Chloroherpeton thalassium]ACF14100.1 conserved hypothetical protein [Chloroherpeton thalassium ATCC 35110]